MKTTTQTILGVIILGIVFCLGMLKQREIYKAPVYRVYYEFNVVIYNEWHHNGHYRFNSDTIPVDTIYKQVNYDLDSSHPVLKKDCNENYIEAKYNVYFTKTDTIYKERL